MRKSLQWWYHLPSTTEDILAFQVVYTKGHLHMLKQPPAAQTRLPTTFLAVPLYVAWLISCSWTEFACPQYGSLHYWLIFMGNVLPKQQFSMVNLEHHQASDEGGVNFPSSSSWTGWNLFNTSVYYFSAKSKLTEKKGGGGHIVVYGECMDENMIFLLARLYKYKNTWLNKYFS